ncbi:MAG: hypothetical protein R3C01_01975 [Planctomycetaceae bacterium]
MSFRLSVSWCGSISTRDAKFKLVEYQKATTREVVLLIESLHALLALETSRVDRGE